MIKDFNVWLQIKPMNQMQENLILSLNFFSKNVDLLLKMWISKFLNLKKIIFFINWQFQFFFPYSLNN